MRSVFFALLILQLNGCAITYIDAGGATKRIGFFSITEKPAPCSLIRTVTTAGLSFDTSPSTAGFNIGYRTITIVRAPSAGILSFKTKPNGELMSYEREYADASEEHIDCQGYTSKVPEIQKLVPQPAR